MTTDDSLWDQIMDWVRSQNNSTGGSTISERNGQEGAYSAQSAANSAGSAASSANQQAMNSSYGSQATSSPYKEQGTSEDVWNSINKKKESDSDYQTFGDNVSEWWGNK